MTITRLSIESGKLLEGSHNLNKKMLLIIEDDADVRHGMQVRLQANNFVTFMAIDAIESISQARKHSRDLIILDLGLPGGNGFIVIEILKSIALTVSISIIVVSARDPSVNQERAMKAGVSAFLQKPVENAELLTVIRTALGEPPVDSAVYQL
jgi:DNA-binding response OmpR family regulator